MNEADALRAAALLESAGYRPVEDARDAGLLLLNTCVVRQQAEDKIHSRLKYVADLKQKNPDITIALMGCMIGRQARQQERIREQYSFVDVFMSPSNLEGLHEYLAREGLTAGYGMPQSSADADDIFDEPLPLPASQNGRAVVAHVPAVLGCSHACTYCVIPYRRGREISRPSATILQEAENLVRQGVREIIVLGQIVDRYGLDRPDEIHLPELLRRLSSIPAVKRVRFLTSHPNWITDDLIETVAATDKVMPYFEIPVQAGSPAILTAMRRGYDADRYEELIARIRSRIPHMGLSTDMIVGFPGETATDFEASMDLMRRIQPDMIRIAKYSPRPLTYSARHLPDDVPEEEKERRRVAMEKLLRDILTEKHKPVVGTVEEVLVERMERHGRVYGRTPAYKPVFIDDATAQPGDIVPARITWAGPFSWIAVRAD